MVERVKSVLVYGIVICLFVVGMLVINSQIGRGEAAMLAPPAITFSNITGVSGYEIGIFGSGFGDSGHVTILNAYATILEWEDGFIRAVVPEVADGTGLLNVVRQNGDVASTSFTVYSIDPLFLQPTSKTFDEISFDKTLYLDGVEFAYCNDINNGAPIETGRFLTNYRCGSGGIVGSGEAVFAADAAQGTTATLAFKSATALSGEHIYQFTSDTYWEPYHESQASWRKSYPRTYTIDVSADSTNGVDGTWTTLQTVADNNRTTRYHTVNIPAAGNYTWLRMHVTDGYADYSDPAGRDFLLREVHIYQTNGSGRPDSMAIYGDSLTYSAFDIIGPQGFAAQAMQHRLSDGALPFTVYGLPGAKADRLMDTSYFDSDIYDAFAIDNMANNTLYWGIALGTNDIGGGAVNLNDPNSFLMQFDERLDAAVQALLDRGRVPILARMPDTNEAAGGYGDTASKQKVLADIDTIAATYRLIPGPDLFTLFRRDIETNNASYISGDGTHHTYIGRKSLIDAWVAAFVAPFPQNTAVPTPQPTLTAQATTPPGTPSPPATATPVVAPTATPNVPASDAGINIEVANRAGVIGYEIGIFGTGFGNTMGNVAIYGATAQVVEWTDRFVKAIVPAVPDGEGLIHLQSAAGSNAYAPFSVYTIDPAFLQAPEVVFSNIAAGKFVHTENLESWFCYQQPSNVGAEPSEFLTDYRCGYNGVTRTGSAKFSADSSQNKVAIVALDLEQTLLGEYYFSYFVNGNWYPRPNTGTYPESNPRDYELQVSADSTNGSDGTWQTVLTVTGNDRSQRTHKLTVPSGGYHWLRMRVTDGNADETATAGRDFGLREIRLFAPSNGNIGTRDSLVIYGDSLTASNFETIGTLGLAAKIKALRGTNQDMPLTTYGLAGQNSSGLVNSPDVAYDIYDALAQDNMQENARFWGIALGTNDALDSAQSIGVAGFNITEYGGRLDAAVADLIALGRVPIVARIPDTDEARGGYGTLATKRKVLGDIDGVMAKYRLIPGPDLYTAFRDNIETSSSSFLSGDGTHHSDAGMLKMLELWSEAFVAAVPAVPSTTPLPTPLPTYTPSIPPTATNTPMPTATNTPLPTATNTPFPTATNTPLPTNTPIPTATNTPLPTATNTPIPTATNTPLPTATNTPIPTATNTPLPTATNTPLPTATNTPLPTETSTPLPTATDTPPVGTFAGDVSCDMLLDAQDAAFIAGYVVHARTAVASCPVESAELNIAQCDVDADGACDMVDALYIVQCAAGISNSLCDGQSSAGTRQSAQQLPPAKLKLFPVSEGQIAVAADMPRRTRFGASAVDIGYDPTRVRPVGCDLADGLVGACNLTFAAGTVRLAIASSVAGSDLIDFADLYFAPVMNGVTSAAISATGVQVTDNDGTPLAINGTGANMSIGGVPTVIGLESAESLHASPLRWITITFVLLLSGSLLAYRIPQSQNDHGTKNHRPRE